MIGQVQSFIPFPASPHLIFWKCETEYIDVGGYFQRNSNLFWKDLWKLSHKKVSLHQTDFISLFREWWNLYTVHDDFFSFNLYRVSENVDFLKYHPIWIVFETFIISRVFIISPQSHQACSWWYYSIWPRLGQEKGCLGNASQIYLISPTFRKLLRTDLHRKTLFSAFWFSWMIKHSKILLLQSIIKQTYKYDSIAQSRIGFSKTANQE